LPVLALALQDRPITRPSASVIASSSWRRSVLEALLEYYVRIPDRYPLVRGTLFHSGFEALQAPAGVELIREKRMQVQIPKYEERILSGQIDLYYPQHRRLEDYKTCTQIPNLILPDHIVQLAVYYWLLTWHGFAVDSVAINYLSWHDCRQVSRTEFRGGSEGEAIGHVLFQNETYFIQYVVDGWDVLENGYARNEVPSTKECDLRYCRTCPVKWACDQVDVWGEVINPANFRQEDYT